MKIIYSPDFVDAIFVNIKKPFVEINATENSDEENPLCLTIVLSMEQAKDVWFELNKEFGNK